MSLIPYKNLYIVTPTTGDGGTALTNNFMTLADEMEDKAPSTDPVFSGKVGIGITPEYDLDVNGDIRQRNIVTHTVTRAVPTTAGNAVDIGSLTLTNGSASLWISITVASTSFSVVKQYLLSVQYTSSPENIWKRAMPVTDSGPFGSNDFWLEIKVDGAVASLRIRRTTGTTAGNAYIVLRQEGVNTDDFTPSTTVSSGASPTPVFGNTVITQRSGEVHLNGMLRMNDNAIDMGSGNLYNATWVMASYLGGDGSSISNVHAVWADGASSANYASYAANAGYASNAANANYASNAANANYASNAGNANYATSAGAANTASNATHANYADAAGYASNTGYADNAGYASSAGYAGCAGFANNASTAAYATNAGHASTADLAITSYADSAGYASSAGSANWAAYAPCAGWANNAGSANWAAFAPCAGWANNTASANWAAYAPSAGYANYANTANYASNANHAGYADTSAYAACAGFAYWLSGNHSSYSYGYALFMNNGGGSGGGAIYMDSGEIVSLRAENRPAAPAGPNPGQIYFNTSNGHFYGWNGSSWVQLD